MRFTFCNTSDFPLMQRRHLLGICGIPGLCHAIHETVGNTIRGNGKITNNKKYTDDRVLIGVKGPSKKTIFATDKISELRNADIWGNGCRNLGTFY